MISALRHPLFLLAAFAACTYAQSFHELQKVDGCNNDQAFTLERDISIVRNVILKGSEYYGAKKDDHTNAYYNFFVDRGNQNPDTAGLSKYFTDLYGYFWPSGPTHRRRDVSNIVLNGVCDNKHAVCSTDRAAAVDITGDDATRTVKISVCDKYFDDKQYLDEDCKSKFVSDVTRYKATEILHALISAPGPFGGLTQVAWGEQDSYNLVLGTFAGKAKDKDGKLICGNGNCDPKLAANNADTKAIMAAIGYGKVNCGIGKLHIELQCKTVQAFKKADCDKNCMYGCSPVRKAIEKRRVIYDETPTRLVWECLC